MLSVMRSVLALLGLLVLSSLAYGQAAPALKLGDIQGQGGKQLTAAELREFLPGTKVRSADKNYIRYWENNADGKLLASANSIVPGRGRSQAMGTWHLADNGTYCVQLEWMSVTESWCRFVFKLGDKYYLFTSATNQAGYAWEIGFSR